MPKNVYSEINLHITWHTKLSDPVLVETIENRVHHYLEHRARETKSVRFHAVDGTENHIHLVVSVPPSLLISDWIGKLKGGSSFYINHEVANRKLLDWQEGYGVVSFGTKDLEWVIRYVKNQKEHHAAGSTNQRLERSDDDDCKGR
ncbi:MAG TPA: IS200/IS605 family transposase [Blastocatellia bacterium]|jgi:REP element-mobilizing transposase RayT|nr:IS200/IS605 family transposase [Blastocatellia bacterium]